LLVQPVPGDSRSAIQDHDIPVKVSSSINSRAERPCGEARVAWAVAGVHSRIVATDEIRAKDLTGCLITLLYGDEQILVVLLDKAGSINRLGDGTPSQADKTLYIGVVRGYSMS